VMLEFHDGPHATPPPADEGPIYLGIKNMTEAGSLDLSAIRHVSMADFPRWTKRVTPQAGDLVFTYEATLHRYALIPKAFEGCLGRRVALVRPRRDVVDPEFLLFYMLGPEWRETVEDRVITGATVDRIPLVDFPTFPVRLPPLSQQRRIAGVLGAFDTLIEINERRIELLEDLARTLYREWFVHFRVPGHIHAGAHGPEGDEMSEGWSELALEDLCSLLKSGGTPSRSDLSNWVTGTRPWFKTGELRDGPLFDSVEHVTDRAGTRVFDPPAIFMAIYGSPTVGRLGWITRASSCNQAALALRAGRPHLEQDWLWFELESLREHFNAMAQGAAQQNISRQKVAETLVKRPPDHLLATFAAAVGPVRALWVELAAACHRLSQTRDLLLPRLVTGQLDISDIDLGVSTPADSE
jgi:type I restriction enzyme, S subunit